MSDSTEDLQPVIRHALLVLDLERRCNAGEFDMYHGVRKRPDKRAPGWTKADDTKWQAEITHLHHLKRVIFADNLRALFGPAIGHETCFVMAVRMAQEHWIAPNMNNDDFTGVFKQNSHVNIMAWYRRLSTFLTVATAGAKEPCYPKFWQD
jgi:hypothetical protein